MLGLAVQEGTPSKKIEFFRKRHHVTYPLLSDEKMQVAGRFGIRSIPTIVILDREGRFRAKDPDDLDKALAPLLK